MYTKFIAKVYWRSHGVLFYALGLDSASLLKHFLSNRQLLFGYCSKIKDKITYVRMNSSKLLMILSCL